MDDHSNFNTVTFALLLEKSKGDRSITQYANKVDVSAAHISRLLRKLVKSPPSPETINKFASDAYNGVTYSELMFAAGHINYKTEESPTNDERVKIAENKNKIFQAIISDLYSREVEFSLNKTINAPADLMLEMINWKYSKWDIKITSFVNSTTLYNVYGEIACMELAADIKVSIAVGSKIEFDLFINKPPKSLRANLYVMLIDLNQNKIIKEEKLCQY
ncbi:hypothetical protein [Clostridium sp. CF012]|uniref:hypothetical protein n=1 Tax=Clostridium sp. CF012 TaxID=2843319 RepID=UPI001C0CFAD8|nr:hypothetical protein [Clostridium sp. CF012]MBU3146004.1 hypothetical protein [Clostridium sp. CF012]